MKIRNADLRRVIESAERRGWESSKTRNGHVLLKHPDHGIVFAPSTPSDHRGVKNFEAQLRRSERRSPRPGAH